MIRSSALFLGVLALVLCFGLTVHAEETKGKVKSVNADKNEFVMTDTAGKDFTIHLDPTGKVFIDNKAAKLSDLQAGEEVTVTYQLKDNKLMASEIRATKK
ncbi:MAG TPA: hypothetical protein VGZ47_07355 [Gemmataceae bacterium]|jgi:hypothetical protein|nr:hypothetical protein [Gemmataceae bacterium]